MIRYCKFANLQDFMEESRFWGIPAAETPQMERFLNVPLFFCAEYPPRLASKLLKKCVAKRSRLSCITGKGGQITNFVLVCHAETFPNREELGIDPEEEMMADFWRELKRVIDNVKTDRWSFQTRGRELRIERPLIMGILNVTPDSFSDGGRYLERERAIERAEAMLDAGADIIDVGGESTRPGAREVTAEEEWNRIGEVVKALVNIPNCLVSVDTYKSEVARRALEAGAHLINDISGFSFDPQMAEVVAGFEAPAVLMHIQGTPRDMQKNPRYRNLMFDIISFLRIQCEYARNRGVRQLIVDPGIGFGKRFEDNFEIIRRLEELKILGCPILVGPSRKSFIGRLLNVPEDRRLAGTLTAVITAVLNGARIVRVHDVTETRHCLQVLKAIREGKFATKNLV